MSAGDHFRRGIEAALLEESADELYEHAPCGYLSTLPDGSIVKVNQTFLDWIGAERDVMLAGTKLQTLLTVGSRLYYETHYAPLLRMQGAVKELALEVRRQDGRIVPVLVNARKRSYRPRRFSQLVERIRGRQWCQSENRSVRRLRVWWR